MCAMAMDKIDMIKFENDFPSSEKAIEFIQKLKATDLRNISLVDLDNLISSVFKNIPFATGHILNGETLFRARVNDNKKDFENISELGMKQKENVFNYGRVNCPNESVFYCASNFELACSEVLQNIKYSFNPQKEIGITTVSEWETLKDLHISPIYYSKAVMERRKDIEEFKRNNSEFLRKKGVMTSETLDVSDLILEFFCDEFAKIKIATPDDYKFSVWYAWRLKRMNDQIVAQYEDNKFDGVVYPSVAMKFKGDNIALFDNDLDSKIKFKTAYVILCAGFDFENVSFKSFKIRELDSIDKDGRLKWN